MKCHQARELVWAYLDSELDVKTLCDIEQHLEECAECSGVFEAEKRFNQRIVAAVSRGRRSPGLWASLERRLISRVRHRVSVPFLSPFRAARLGIAAGVLTLMAVLLGWILGSLDGPKVALADAVASCHEAYVNQSVSPEFVGPVPQEVLATLGEGLDPEAFAYRPDKTLFDCEGSRTCQVAGMPVAWILGHHREVPVSVIVFQKRFLTHFPKLRRQFEKESGIVCDKTGRYQFAARLMDGHVVCAVGQTPRTELENLLRTVTRTM